MTRSSMASMMRSINSLSAGLVEFDSLSALCPGAPDELVRPTSDEPPPLLVSSSSLSSPGDLKIVLPAPPDPVRRTTPEPAVDRKMVVDGDDDTDGADLETEPPPEANDRRIGVEDPEEPDDDDEEEDDEEDAFDEVVRVLRWAAGRAAGLRRMVASAGAGDGAPGGAGGAAPASALISPPVAPTTKPAVPNVGVRPSAAG